MPAVALDAKRQPFIEHIEELRSRLIWCVVSLALGTALGYWQRNAILTILLKPVNQPLFYTSPVGGLHFLFKISFFVGFLFAIPAVVYHLLKFLEPALPRSLKSHIVLLLFASLFLMLLGLCFAYFISLPMALRFLSNFDTGPIKSLILADEYLSFVVTYLSVVALVFQLPLLFLFINRITPLSPKGLLKKLPWVILVSIIIAGFMAPPDVINQVIMILPLLSLYLISIFLVWFFNRHRPQVAPEYEAKPLRRIMDIRRHGQ